MREQPKAQGGAEQGVGRRGYNAGFSETHIPTLWKSAVAVSAAYTFFRLLWPEHHSQGPPFGVG
jgi:hypothetical protein